jgi:hypothetical protein
MNRYLFTTLPSNDLGLITRSLPIARELRNRGHEIAFCNPARVPAKWISEAGFRNIPPEEPAFDILAGRLRVSRLLRSPSLGRNIRLLASFARNLTRSGTAEIWDVDHFMSLFGMCDAEFVRANVEAVGGIIRRFRPDVVVDFWNPFACIAARAGRRPLVTVIQADMHPQSRGFLWWKNMPRAAYPSPVPAVNAVLAGYGMASIKKVGELFIGDATLVLGIPETDPLPQAAGAVYIGPILWQKQDDPLPAWIAGLGRKEPLVWLYPGNLRYVRGADTFGDSAVVLETCIEALGNEAVRVVLTTGHHELPRKFSRLPGNFRHKPCVPGPAMAMFCDLVIHHGGYGSCQTALLAGKPSLVIPTYSERESNARRIAACGAGDYVLPQSDDRGRRKRISAREVRSKALRILSDGSFLENAGRIGKKLRNRGGAVEAADRIEHAG